MLSWLKSMVNEFDKIVDVEKVAALKEQLRELNTKITALEADKRKLLAAARRGVPEEPGHVILEIDAVRNVLRKVVGSLREQYKAGGVEVEGLLSKATGPNKDWAYELLRTGRANPQLLEKGDAAVENLKRASIELAKLIANLR